VRHCTCVEATNPSFTAAAPLTDDEEAAAMNLAVLIVVPIFLACYAGSCIAYIIYKIHRTCRRRHDKPHAANLDNIETPGSTGRGAGAPAALPAYLPAAPDQPRPAPTTAALSDGPAGHAKAPASYDTPTDGADGGVPISEILMKKMAQRSNMAAAY